MAGYRGQSERRAEVAQWRASGQTVAAYCAERGMSEESLRRWRKEAEGSRRPGAPSFVRVELAAVPVERGLTLEVGRTRVRVERGFDAALLRELVEALTGEARA